MEAMASVLGCDHIATTGRVTAAQRWAREPGSRGGLRDLGWHEVASSFASAPRSQGHRTGQHSADKEMSPVSTRVVYQLSRSLRPSSEALPGSAL